MLYIFVKPNIFLFSKKTDLPSYVTITWHFPSILNRKVMKRGKMKQQKTSSVKIEIF